MIDFDFDPLEPLPMRPEEEVDSEVWQPRWNCFCCQDTGKVQANLVKHVIPDYDYDGDRLPVCQNCNKGHNWVHLNELNVIDTRLGPQICKKLDLIAREDWRLTCKAWFEWTKDHIEQGITEIAQKQNLRKRDRIQAEFIYALEKHGLKRGDWEVVRDSDDEDEEDLSE